MSEKVKRIILCSIPMSICNFRCPYCYLAQRESSFEGKQIQSTHDSKFIKKAFSKKRLGGSCYFNLCADGETMLVKNINMYVKSILEAGHYVEIVSNMTITNVIHDLIESLSSSLLAKLSFKCSFHYLELKNKNLLETYADNINFVRSKGASITIEMVGADIYIPYIQEIKEYSIKNFGALPHITIARDDRNNRTFLTSLSHEEYLQTWNNFNSNFFKFKSSIFDKKRKEFCYAGMWSLKVNLVTGIASQCYMSNVYQDIYSDLDKPIKWVPICRCKDYHCYNGHSLLSVGLIPSLNTPKYGSELRNRLDSNTGQNWYNDTALSFYDSKLIESNKKIRFFAKTKFRIINYAYSLLNRCNKTKKNRKK